MGFTLYSTASFRQWSKVGTDLFLLAAHERDIAKQWHSLVILDNSAHARGHRISSKYTIAGPAVMLVYRVLRTCLLLLSSPVHGGHPAAMSSPKSSGVAARHRYTPRALQWMGRLRIHRLNE